MTVSPQPPAESDAEAEAQADVARFVLHSQGETEELAARLARVLRAGDAVMLSGPIGAGKSTLVRALLRVASGDPALDVPSPTFTLVQSYTLPDGVVVHHFDLWRLEGPESLAELGWEDALRDIVLVEWPERLRYVRPDGALDVALTVLSDESREVRLAGWPDRLPRLLPEKP